MAPGPRFKAWVKVEVLYEEFMGFKRILWDFIGFYEILWDFRGFYEDFMIFYRVL